MRKYIFSCLLIMISMSTSSWAQFVAKMPHPKIVGAEVNWTIGDTLYLSDPSIKSLEKQSGAQISKGVWTGNAATIVVGLLDKVINYFTTGTLVIKMNGHHLIFIEGQIYGFQDQLNLTIPYGGYTYFLAENNYSQWIGPYHANIEVWDTVLKQH